MTYLIIYDAVRKKASTTPPNLFIGNVEMAAGIGLVMKELGKEFDVSEITKPEEIKERFLDNLKGEDVDKLSSQGKIIFGLIQQYQVKKMVNEKLNHLLDLCRMKQEEEEES